MAIPKEVMERLAALEAENARLKEAAEKATSITMKVSEKGAVSVYGLGKWPVTLYASMWARLFKVAQTVLRFAWDNREKLAWDKTKPGILGSACGDKMPKTWEDFIQGK